MDAVVVRDLRVTTHVGVTEEERQVPQDVLVSLEVLTDMAEASRSDDVVQTVDYGVLVHEVAKLIERSENRLLETLAGDIAAFVERISGVTGVTVEVAKADPPVEENVGRIAVRIERKFT